MVMYTVNPHVCEYFESIGQDPRLVAQNGKINVRGYERFVTDAHGKRVKDPNSEELLRETVPWTIRKYNGFLVAKILDRLDNTSRFP